MERIEEPNIEPIIKPKPPPQKGSLFSSCSCSKSKSAKWPRFKYSQEESDGFQMILNHVTNYKAGKAILNSGRMNPGSKGWFGGGIYFAPSKEECLKKTIGGKGQEKYMITAKVSLGKIMRITDVYKDKYKNEFHYITYEQLRQVGFQSVHAITNTGEEYVAYRSEDVRVMCGLDLTALAEDKKKIDSYLTQIEKVQSKMNEDLKQNQEQQKADVLAPPIQMENLLNEMVQVNQTFGLEIDKVQVMKEVPIVKELEWPRFKYDTEGYQGYEMILNHVTNSSAGLSIIRNGKMLPGKSGWFGPGIYFAPNKKECMEKMKGGKGPDKYLITARVSVGKIMKIADVYNDPHRIEFKEIGHEKLQKAGFGSVHACTNTGEEFVVYRPEDVKEVMGQDLRPIAFDFKKFESYLEQIYSIQKKINNLLLEDTQNRKKTPEKSQAQEKIIDSHFRAVLQLSQQYGIDLDKNLNKTIGQDTNVNFSFSSEGKAGTKRILKHFAKLDEGRSFMEFRSIKPDENGKFGDGLSFVESEEDTLEAIKSKHLFLILARVELGKSMMIQENAVSPDDLKAITSETLENLGLKSLNVQAKNGPQYVVYRFEQVELLLGVELNSNSFGLVREIDTQLNQINSRMMNSQKSEPVIPQILTTLEKVPFHCFAPRFKHQIYQNNESFSVFFEATTKKAGQEILKTGYLPEEDHGFGRCINLSKSKEPLLKKIPSKGLFLLVLGADLSGRNMLITNTTNDPYSFEFLNLCLPYIRNLNIESVEIKKETGNELLIFDSQRVKILDSVDLSRFEGNLDEIKKIVDEIGSLDFKDELKWKKAIVKVKERYGILEEDEETVDFDETQFFFTEERKSIGIVRKGEKHFVPRFHSEPLKKMKRTENEDEDPIARYLDYYIGVPPPVLKEIGKVYKIVFLQEKI